MNQEKGCFNVDAGAIVAEVLRQVIKKIHLQQAHHTGCTLRTKVAGTTNKRHDLDQFFGEILLRKAKK